MKDPYFVYGIVSLKGDLLYIGCSQNLELRLMQHRCSPKFKMRDINIEEMSRHEKKHEALREEGRLISLHNPPYNKARPSKKSTWGAESRKTVNLPVSKAIHARVKAECKRTGAIQHVLAARLIIDGFRFRAQKPRKPKAP